MPIDFDELEGDIHFEARMGQTMERIKHIHDLAELLEEFGPHQEDLKEDVLFVIRVASIYRLELADQKRLVRQQDQLIKALDTHVESLQKLTKHLDRKLGLL